MLAVVILTDNHRNTISEQVVTAALLVLVLVITFAILLLARPLKGIIGNTGANVVSRVMGIVLATVAVDSVLNGFEALGVMALPDSGV
jgi:multiple antibiotic resistance protein